MATKKVSSITIVGVGQVGGAVAYALILRSACDELLLVDNDVEQGYGQARDLSDAAYSSGSKTRVRLVSHREGSQSDIIVIAAASKHPMGETRLEHTHHNISIMRSIIDEMSPLRPDTVLLVISQPVDLLTSVALKLSKLPHNQVLGAGTYLESARLRGMVADKAHVSANSIDMYVLGVQGPQQVTAWSSATVGGVPLDKALPAGTIDKDKIATESAERSHKILLAKGSMPFGVGSVIASVCTSVLNDERKVRPISYYEADFGCCFSRLAAIGRQGVAASLPTALSESEMGQMVESAEGLADTLSRINDL
ncbi:uncharacterized protein F5Z01DRAFT_224736 [Emericellopsis atlantica]|uniref:L-lactate dehydrogenase n=1 Tax=Emericellopsis atlantica TaxID=2614577 RepID=A0A9P8CM57_9HYPO|nr:uncharacterized protein F5Z01DRAFT_224736 [Emericellopsis atlantica]KAG9252374.1 hypothetical protein F5Z01DRAFT_224736 [Emericellopsis atlantica]